MTLFVDSAYVIALINERDQYHTQAKDLARRYRDRPLLVTEGVLLEIGNALAGQRGSPLCSGRFSRLVFDPELNHKKAGPESLPAPLFSRSSAARSRDLANRPTRAAPPPLPPAWRGAG